LKGKTYMSDFTAELPEAIECPLCLGKGKLSRTEVLERLGMRDFSRVAQLSAEEAIRLIVMKEKDAEQARWAKFESELSRRVAEVTGTHQAELHRLQSEKAELSGRLKLLEDSAVAMLDNTRQQERLAAEQESQKQLIGLTRRIAELEAAQKLAEEQKSAEVAKARAELESTLNAEKARANDLSRQTKDYFQEITGLRERNQELESEMAKVARVGRKEEVDFAAEVRSWPGVWLGDKLPRNGDYMLAFADAAGNAVEPSMLVDNKDKATVAEADIRKLIRDAKERKLHIALLVTRDESQLRHVDRQRRWSQQDGVWLLRSTRAWRPRDLEVLRPLFERMRAEGPDFLQKNAALADEVRRTLVDIDAIEAQLKKAGTAIETAQALTATYRARLSRLCDSTAAGRKMPTRPGRKNGKVSAGNGNVTQERWPAGQQQDLA
jgi:DNA repair exonuclease SbcCD ATPase subunit